MIKIIWTLSLRNVIILRANFTHLTLNIEDNAKKHASACVGTAV